MVIHVADGKGQRDRYVMASPTLLHCLRAWWRAARPTAWLFPGQQPGHPLDKGAVQWACRLARFRSGIVKPLTPHSLRHYAVSRTMPSAAGASPALAENALKPESERLPITRHSVVLQTVQEAKQIITRPIAIESAVEWCRLREGAFLHGQGGLEIDLRRFD
jgi:integrase